MPHPSRNMSQKPDRFDCSEFQRSQLAPSGRSSSETSRGIPASARRSSATIEWGLFEPVLRRHPRYERVPDVRSWEVPFPLATLTRYRFDLKPKCVSQVWVLLEHHNKQTRPIRWRRVQEYSPEKATPKIVPHGSSLPHSFSVWPLFVGLLSLRGLPFGLD